MDLSTGEVVFWCLFFGFYAGFAVGMWLFHPVPKAKKKDHPQEVEVMDGSIYKNTPRANNHAVLFVAPNGNRAVFTYVEN